MFKYVYRVYCIFRQVISIRYVSGKKLFSNISGVSVNVTFDIVITSQETFARLGLTTNQIN